MCVIWNSCKSEYFILYNGVMQGGAISCYLFNLYIDPLLVQLSNSGWKIISFLTLRKQFVLNLEELLWTGNLHFLTV